MGKGTIVQNSIVGPDATIHQDCTLGGSPCSEQNALWKKRTFWIGGAG